LGATTGGITFDGGTLSSTGIQINTNRAVTLSAGGGTISTAASGNPGLTFSQDITGTGSFTKTGTGLLRFNGADKTFTGDIYILQGILEGVANIVGDGVRSGDMYILGGSFQFDTTANTQMMGTNNIVYLGNTTGSTNASITKANNSSQTSDSDLWVRL